ncbi:quinate 5-dehydrogenase [Selenihalanaerobacter shriftii]|uniref:Quinate 5-dehydrogenase n=1 Tax=Selenihalanaerobacter shriftii TaxID=142842 RepID=A0A1T4QVL5_9FIRM|nr:quinate 5-dehydrogenase [Selenihalanaerobacter shriftii]SKA07521.1 hypothetical protein SAMN02745118_02705 [Selenihalanaerobacter shriftii]
MKRIVSVSLGSSRRDHSVKTEILNEEVLLERVGTDGDFKKAKSLFAELDGQVDALGVGGIDLHIYSQNKKYSLRDAKRLVSGVKETPLADGSGLKMTLEKKVILDLEENNNFNLKGKNVLLVSAADRFGMALAFEELGCNVHYGDLIFGLGLPFPIKSLKLIDRAIRLLGPVVCQMPFKILYPTGSKQETSGSQKYKHYYEWADVIAGDFHLIKKYLPKRINNKVIITNTVTDADVELLKRRGLGFLVTTTPELNGRSFGTNLLEAALITFIDKPKEEIEVDDYLSLLNKVEFNPRIEVLNKKEIC